VPAVDPIAAAASAKRTASLLREARSVLRRLDSLLATARADGDSSAPRVAEARDTVERLVTELTFREHTEQRRARQAIRQLR
jgi:hypothetical protein